MIKKIMWYDLSPTVSAQKRLQIHYKPWFSFISVLWNNSMCVFLEEAWGWTYLLHIIPWLTNKGSLPRETQWDHNQYTSTRCTHTHTLVRTTQIGNDVRLPGAHNNQLHAHTVCKHTHSCTASAYTHRRAHWKTLNMQIIFLQQGQHSIVHLDEGGQIER